MKMFDRRKLLKTGLGIGLGGTVFGTAAAQNGASRHRPDRRALTAGEGGTFSGVGSSSLLGTNLFDQKWAQADLEGLGIPRSWWHVHQGLFPFAPERVLVINKRPCVWYFRSLKERLLERGYGKDKYFSEEKLDYAIWIMQTLTTFYGVQDYLEDWADRLAGREDLGPAMGFCGGRGFVHQFQRRDQQQPVRTQNGLVDWWLFLVPNGVDFQALDDLPTHVLFGCVDASVSRELPCFSLISYLGRSLDNVVELSRMDRLAAVRFLNERILQFL